MNDTLKSQHGVDPAEPAIAYARRHARPGLTFTVGIAQDLSLADSSFDVVAVRPWPSRGQT